MEGKPDNPATTATPPAGTRQMGPPVATGAANTDNQEAASGEQELPPYVILGEPVADSPILDFFNSLPIFAAVRRKLDAMLDKGKVYKRTFSCNPDEEEHLKETFACCVSTATAGPVAGTLYLTKMNFAFCSDRPLSFAGRMDRPHVNYYYKAMIPLGKIATVEPVTMMESPFPPVEYVLVVTVDSHDFWFMDFVVSSDEAVRSLVEAVFQHGVDTADRK